MTGLSVNRQNADIQFTKEIEENGKIPFLDCLVTRDNDNKLSTTVYRKPTQKVFAKIVDLVFVYCCKKCRLRTVTRTVVSSLTNQVNNQRHIYHLLTFHNSLDSEDDFRSGCRNVSQSHLKQFFSGLHSPG